MKTFRFYFQRSIVQERTRTTKASVCLSTQRYIKKIKKNIMANQKEQTTANQKGG